MTAQPQLTERDVVRHAQAAVARSLSDHGQVLPGAVMLIIRDPQSEAALPGPDIVAMLEPAPLASPEALESFLGGLRAEALRLGGQAIALLGEAQAEIEGGAVQRVAVIRMEDAAGVQLMHAPIDAAGPAAPRVGSFVASPEAPDFLDVPLLPQTLAPGALSAATEAEPDGRKRLPIVD